MLQSISIQNLGCFDDSFPYTINFKKLNIIAGPNNSGKSTIFKGFNFLRAYSFGGVAWTTQFYHLADFEQSVYAHDVKKEIKITATYQEGADNYVASFNISSSGIKNPDFFKNGTRIAGINSEEHKELASKIWYIGPNRAGTPQQIAVGTSIVQLGQPLTPNGSNVIQYLLERWTGQDARWTDMVEWLAKIDPHMQALKTPILSNTVRLETTRNDGNRSINVNMSLQGTGIQNAATIVAALIFSPEGSTIIIEEPENFLHSKSVEVLVDLINHAVNKQSKQIIITTHSWDMLTTYANDLGNGLSRASPPHEITNIGGFQLFGIKPELSAEKIEPYDIQGKTIGDIWTYVRGLLGDTS